MGHCHSSETMPEADSDTYVGEELSMMANLKPTHQVYISVNQSQIFVSSVLSD
jgi:hypothetical protein